MFLHSLYSQKARFHQPVSLLFTAKHLNYLSKRWIFFLFPRENRHTRIPSHPYFKKSKSVSPPTFVLIISVDCIFFPYDGTHSRIASIFPSFKTMGPATTSKHGKLIVVCDILLVLLGRVSFKNDVISVKLYSS